MRVMQQNDTSLEDEAGCQAAFQRCLNLWAAVHFPFLRSA
ncbi:hypothetical protein E6C60_1633 [Paenibacillus algicola]|uniref:Uncharacterized protein n=1 Tax=Paenibacillus algicola TaxID=2565926 RepID=A0A4P8XPN8_9BACL|nr:hypothetical protein E6C60_1633 [Paenibacillus algicola]